MCHQHLRRSPRRPQLRSPQPRRRHKRQGLARRQLRLLQRNLLPRRLQLPLRRQPVVLVLALPKQQVERLRPPERVAAHGRLRLLRRRLLCRHR
jgi:hypothetical protein